MLTCGRPDSNRRDHLNPCNGSPFELNRGRDSMLPLVLPHGPFKALMPNPAPASARPFSAEVLILRAPSW